MTGIRATGYHGVLDHERRERSGSLVADVVLQRRHAARGGGLPTGWRPPSTTAALAGPRSGTCWPASRPTSSRPSPSGSLRWRSNHPAVAAVNVVLRKPEAPVGVPVADVAVEGGPLRERLPAGIRCPGPARSTRRRAAEVIAEPAVPTVVAPAVAARAGTGRPNGGRNARRAAGRTGVAGRTVRAAGRAARDGAGLGVGGRPGVGAGGDGPAGRRRRAGPGPVARAPRSEADPLDAVPGGPVDVVLALGSNLGSSQGISAQRGLRASTALCGARGRHGRPLARTAAVGPGPRRTTSTPSCWRGRR